jgi:hypothetical protein
LKFERQFVVAFLIAVCATLARAIHEHWYLAKAGLSFFESPVTRYGEEAYRVGVPALGRLILYAFHLSDTATVAAAMDFWFAFFALYLLYRLLDMQSADIPNRPAAVGFSGVPLFFHHVGRTVDAY